MQRVILAAAVAGPTLALLEWAASPNAHPVVLACDIVAGWSFLIGCVVAAGAVPNPRMPVLFLLTGIAWFIGAAFLPWQYLYVGPLVVLLITYPTGRVRQPIQGLVAASGFLASVLAGVGALTAAVPAVMALSGVVALTDVRGVPGPLRRGRRSAAVAAVAIVVPMTGAGWAAAQGWMAADAARSVTSLAVAASAVWLAADLRWGGWVADALARLVIDLGAAEPTSVRDLLRVALDDNGLVLGYVVEGTSGFVDERGQAVALPDPGSRWSVVPLMSGGLQIGVLIRDADTESDASLGGGVAAAAALAVENARLNAAVNAQLVDLSASRDRQVAAVEAQRASLQANVTDRIIPLLAGVSRAIPNSMGRDGERLRKQVAAIAAQLHELAAGVGPTDVAIHGLAHAVRSIAEQCPISVSVSVHAPDVAGDAAATAFFVSAEGLANASKHARATRAWVDIWRTGDDLVVEVRDNGIGGAVVAAGSGLKGLTDRLRARGGTIEIGSAAEGGVRLLARLPVERHDHRSPITDLA